MGSRRFSFQNSRMVQVDVIDGALAPSAMRKVRIRHRHQQVASRMPGALEEKPGALDNARCFRRQFAADQLNTVIV
jgi:hypothetical protein